MNVDARVSVPSPLPRRSRVVDGLFRIHTKLLVVNVFLVVVPIAGLAFARFYERELLRSEEEGMRALARTVSAAASAHLASGEPFGSDAVATIARAGAHTLRAQLRLVDTNGRAVVDTGPESVEIVTRGRELVSSVDVRSRYASLPEMPVGDPSPRNGDYRERPEVTRALAGASGVAARRSQRIRGVTLYLAEPIRRPDGSIAGAVYVSRTTYPVLVSLYRVRNGLKNVAVVSVLIAAALGLFLAFTISRPLRRLTDGARRIAAGERGVTLKLSGRDEVADLARAFDTMSHALDARLAYIGELAANVSHEFKTPIASIRGAAELLRDGAAADPATRDRFLGNIVGDSERLSRLVTRLLELSRVEASLERPVPLDYRALVEEVAARARASSRKVRLSYECPYSHLLGSPEHLDSVIGNLIDNALRFSPADMLVEVRVRAEGADAIRTEVEDRGAGISPANLARVWERFFTTAREDGGTGIGLAIVKAVVEAHGGRVGATSVEGRGSTFWFVLPRRL